MPFKIGDNNYVGGDSSHPRQLLFLSLFKKDEDDSGLPTYISRLDESFNIQEDQKHTIISKEKSNGKRTQLDYDAV